MKPFGIIVATLFLITGCSDSTSYQGYADAENIYLASAYSGVLKTLYVSRGESIKKGQLLFKLDEYPQQFMIEQTQAVVQQQKHLLEDARQPKRPQEIEALEWGIKQVDAQISLAQLRVKRNEVLYKKHVVDKDSLDASNERYEELLAIKNQQEKNLELAKLGARSQNILAIQQGVRSAALKVKEIKWQLQQKTIYAPADGVVFDTYYKVGELVSAERPVLSLISPQNIYIQFFVPSRQLPKIKLGQTIRYTLEDMPSYHLAVISYISPEAEYIPPLVYSRDNSDKLVFRIKAKPKNPMLLKPGQPLIVTSFQ